MKKWKRLLGLALCLCAAVCVMSVSASAAAEHSHPICGAAHIDIGDHTGPCNDVTWIEVTQKDVTDNNGLTLEAGNNYYLGEDIKVKWEITIKGTVNLCLNGHSIVRTEATKNPSFANAVIDVLKVTPQTHFTLCDCKGGGTITHTSGIPGQGVTASADFTMYGGKISGNHAGTDAMHEDGAGVAVGGSTFTMYGGTITDNHVDKMLNYGGGGVVVSGGGKFIMYDGEISRNTSNDAGGVSVVGASFEMHGGTISGNTATGSGGGVGLWNRSFTLSGGTISGNTAKDGGGVYFSAWDSNTLTISDAVEISGNSAANGGGVYLNSRNLKMTGGSIINNNVTGSGGGVYFKGDTFNVSGNVSITGNKNTGSGLTDADNNVYLPADKIITVAGALTGSKIGVTTENIPDNFQYVRIASGTTSNTDPDKFLYENDDTAVSAVVTGRTTKLVACKHNWSGEWTTDAAQHWHVCSICGGKNDVSAHNYDKEVAEESYKASDATCTSPARYYKSCVCGAKGADTFERGNKDPDNHSGALGDWQSDENNHWQEYTCCHVPADKAPHNWDTGVIKKQPTCTTAGEKTFTCTDCNRTKTETVSATGHSWSKEWKSDATHHWHECENANCDVTENSAKDGYAAHSGGTANCTQQAVCTICGTAYGALDANGHDWGEWVVTKLAITSAAGEETRTCKRNASHTEKRAIPKLTPAPSDGGSSSGSSGGSSSTPAITVPVSGSGDTVHVSASVSGSTAEVKEIKSAELDKIGTDSAVVIDLSGLNKGVTSVTLSTDTIDSICKTEADGVTVKLPSAELRVDRQTLAAVTEQAAGSKIRLVVEPDSTARGTMTAAQKSTLAGMKNAAALEAYFVSNNTRIHDFKGGSVELSIPYRAKGAIRAWFLKEDGTREPVSARYDKENAQLILHHFSHYVIEELDSSAAYTVCAKDDSCPLGAFGDLTATAWYHDGVHYCLENGLMRGVSGGKFLPDGSTTRAQLVTILWRLEGSPETTGAVRFGDTASGAWYTEAVRWAVGCGVVKGYDNGCFGPNDAVTREQMAAILYRYAQHKGYDVSAGEDTNILSFDDAFAVSEYAIPAMQWACGSGMVHGIARDGRMLLAPGDTTTRAQTATLLMRFQSAFAKEP